MKVCKGSRQPVCIERFGGRIILTSLVCFRGKSCGLTRRRQVCRVGCRCIDPTARWDEEDAWVKPSVPCRLVCICKSLPSGVRKRKLLYRWGRSCVEYIPAPWAGLDPLLNEGGSRYGVCRISDRSQQMGSEDFRRPYPASAKKSGVSALDTSLFAAALNFIHC